MSIDTSKQGGRAKSGQRIEKLELNSTSSLHPHALKAQKS
jgi:hypothetical protein